MRSADRCRTGNIARCSRRRTVQGGPAFLACPGAWAGRLPLYLRTADSLEAALPDVAGNTVVNAVRNRQISYSDPMAFGEAHQLSVIALRTVDHDGVAIS